MGEEQEKGRKTWVQSKISSLLAGIRDVQLYVDGGQHGQALGNPGSGVGGRGAQDWFTPPNPEEVAVPNLGKAVPGRI